MPGVSLLDEEPAAFVIPLSVTTVLFDAGDTLIAYRRPLRIQLQDFFIQQDEILNRDAIAEAVDAISPRYRMLVEQTRTVEEERRMWIEVARDLLDILLPRRRDLYPDLAAWFGEGWKRLKVFRDVRPTLRQLRAGGYRLAVVSNWEPSLALSLDKLGISRFFETIIISAVEGIWKPDPRLFEIALERMQVSAAEAVSVGDDIERDIDTARRVGVHSVLLDRFDAHLEYTPRVRTLSELVTWMPGIPPAQVRPSA